jgi:hypothetical protein
MALPGAPLLINKCTGQTYVLTRVTVHRKSAGPYTYRWQPIAVSDTPEAAPKPATAAPTGHKCFSFDGRQFCP